MALDDSLMDIRLIDRFRRSGTLTEEQVSAFRKKLPDVKDQSEPVRLGPDEAPKAESGKE
jgi:hypothetical protein